ncbi:MAG: hypothetical protein P1S60_18030, partial [Anaerolineae bacterium]|nr:hypothetical protein [Anaerolineae bacterium]
VTIYNLSVESWQSPDLVLDIRCSGGTYIRSLAHDLGHELGCGAHLIALERTASQGFTLADSYTLDILREYADKGMAEQALISPRTALGNMPEAVLSSKEITAVRFGQRITLNTHHQGSILKAIDKEGNLVAVMVPESTPWWQPKVVMPVRNEIGEI